jgi:hypothetical protein
MLSQFRVAIGRVKGENVPWDRADSGCHRADSSCRGIRIVQVFHECQLVTYESHRGAFSMVLSGHVRFGSLGA